MGTATTLESSEDVVTFLKRQHEQIKALFAAVLSSRGEARTQAFLTLRKMLAVHETAEEEIVHPAARRKLPNGEAIVDQRLQEERKAKTDLAELEKIDVQSPEFERKLEALRAEVVTHAEAEERTEFERLGLQLEPAQLTRMRKAVELAEAVAPTRPHPGVESAAANVIAGPFASMIDRARDAISRKS